MFGVRWYSDPDFFTTIGGLGYKFGVWTHKKAIRRRKNSENLTLSAYFHSRLTSQELIIWAFVAVALPTLFFSNIALL